MTARADVRPQYSYSTINWITAVFMVLFHVAAVAAFWFFSWTNVITAIVLHWFAVGFGISLGYHRLHTHRGYKTSRAFEYFLAICGALTLEGGPIFWVATHRVHHQHSDQEGDPHTPHDGGFWAHMGWILFGDTHHNNTALMSKYAPDLAKDPFYRWLNTYHYVPLTVSGLILLAVGGWGMVLWGVGLRVVFGLHATWLVNSATHMWGSRRFNTLVGGPADVWRRLAQQSPRAPGIGAAWPGLVRVRHQLDHPQGARGGRSRARPEGRQGPRRAARRGRIGPGPSAGGDKAKGKRQKGNQPACSRGSALCLFPSALTLRAFPSVFRLKIVILSP
jgi:fatty-acid desaturase